MSISSFFKTIWTDVFGKLNTAEDVAEAFFKAAITDAASQLGAEGLKIIHDAVAAAEAQGGTGGAKLAAAFAKATADLAADGLKVAAHIINAGIEAAVAQLNASSEAQSATTNA